LKTSFLREGKRRYALVALVVAVSPIAPVHAVENGLPAAGNSYAVPIKTVLSPGNTGACSGVLIAPLTVVTAAHCVTDANGKLTAYVYVGLAGSSLASITQANKVHSIELYSDFKIQAGLTVGNNDLAFLILSHAQTLKAPIAIASEAQLAALQVDGFPVTITGYGYYSDTATASSNFPESFTGSLSSSSAPNPNSAWVKSEGADACLGDSGSPVVSTINGVVTVIGIVSGMDRSIDCTAKNSDGSYYTYFTLISRYQDLTLAARAASLLTVVEKGHPLSVQAKRATNTQIASLKSQISQAQLHFGQNNRYLSNALQVLSVATRKLRA
jgi:secreted trypsin-like serine protease